MGKQLIRKSGLGGCLGLALICALACGTQSDSEDSSGGGGTSNDGFVVVEKGMRFTQECSPRGKIEVEIARKSCRIYEGSLIIVSAFDTREEHFLWIGYAGIDPGVRETGQSVHDDLITAGYSTKCDARATDSDEPCTIELLELERGTPQVDKGVEPGSRVKLRVSCPEELNYRGDDFNYWTKQTPQRFEIEATDCEIW